MGNEQSPAFGVPFAQAGLTGLLPGAILGPWVWVYGCGPSASCLLYTPVLLSTCAVP